MADSHRASIALLAVGAGLAVANLYYAQPLLGRIAQDLSVAQASVGRVPVVTQLGYGAGILFLAPLADRLERKRMIVVMTALSAAMCALVAFSRGLHWLVGASFALGVATIVPQLIVPYAAGAARREHRGAAVGTVMSGLLVGILASRTVSGLVGDRFGWRVVYAGAAVIMLLLAVVLQLTLEEQRGDANVRRRELFASLGRLVAREPVLRRHALLGACTFGAFSVFWTTLAFHLAAPPLLRGPNVAGLFGLIGVTGAVAAPIVGRVGDRRDPRLVNASALAVCALSFVVFAVGRRSLLGLAAGVVLLDLGAQSNHITNQTRIYALDPAARNRLNTIYMVTYFAGGALGSWLGATAWALAKWSGVCVAGAAMSLLGLAIFFLYDPARSSAARSAR